jgi:D-alanyl-D-alanine carboxypeptidase
MKLSLKLKVVNVVLALLLTAPLAPPVVAQTAARRAGQTQPGRSLAQRIEAIMARPEFRHAFFGMEFRALDTGKAIYALNADKLFVPGSTTKLLTEGTALELFGPDYRFHTRLYRAGEIKKDGTLDGDLVIVAGGDPNLSGRLRDDGTLFDIQSNTPAAGHVHAKTGTFGVGDRLNGRLLVTGKGLAGYMTTARGQQLAFAIYVNNVSVAPESAAVKRVTGQMLGEIAAVVYESAR